MEIRLRKGTKELIESEATRLGITSSTLMRTVFTLWMRSERRRETLAREHEAAIAAAGGEPLATGSAAPWSAGLNRRA